MGPADHLLRSLLGSQIHYYPIDQYKCVLSHPDAAAFEEWISTKDFSTGERLTPKWHIPCDEEIHFANELLDIHFKSALDDLLKICQTKIHADQGDEKEHMKATLLRIESSLQGLFSCLPDFVPDSRNGMVEDPNHTFLIAGATGCTVGTTALREKATEIVHAACKYVLEKKSDNSILLILIIRIIDALLRLERILDVIGINDTPSGDEDPESWHVQIFRSIDSNSVKGFPEDPREATGKNLVCGKNALIDMSIVHSIPIHHRDMSTLISLLLTLLRGSDVTIVKQSIISGINLLCSCFEEMILQFQQCGKVERWIEEIWMWMLKFKEAVFEIALEGESIGIKPLTLKFLEIFVLLFTSDIGYPEKSSTQGLSLAVNISWLVHSHPVLDPTVLMTEANRTLGISFKLLQCAGNLPGCLTITVVNCLAAIARKRPQHHDTINKPPNNISKDL